MVAEDGVEVPHAVARYRGGYAAFLLLLLLLGLCTPRPPRLRPQPPSRPVQATVLLHAGEEDEALVSE